MEMKAKAESEKKITVYDLPHAYFYPFGKDPWMPWYVFLLPFRITKYKSKAGWEARPLRRDRRQTAHRSRENPKGLRRKWQYIRIKGRGYKSRRLFVWLLTVLVSYGSNPDCREGRYPTETAGYPVFHPVSPIVSGLCKVPQYVRIFPENWILSTLNIAGHFPRKGGCRRTVLLHSNCG